ncbi:MAG: transporter substrate-binding domain-containing protein [Muribaculaceae bacterium]|nr:transporter substrate-binding domain-containing protein [Muribaculaceae bacterium]
MKKLQLKKGSATGYLIGLAVVIILMFMLRKCSNESIPGDDRRAEGDTINVAIELSPLGISTRLDTLSGFHYDLIRTIAAQHNRPLQISAFSSPSAAFDALKEGRYDIVISDIPATSRIKEEFLITDPVYLDKQVLVRRHTPGTDSVIEFSQHILAGDSVWIAHGSPFADRLRNLAHEIGDSIHVIDNHSYGAEQLGMMTSMGQIKQVVMNQRQASQIKIVYPDLDISTPISFNQFQGWVLAPGSEPLRDSINIWLSDFKSSPDYPKLLEKYNLN